MEENYLAKWLNNELSGEALEEFKKSDAYATYQRIVATSKTLESPSFNTERALESVHDKTKKSVTKVVRLSPFKKMMRIAAAAALILTASYFYINSLDKTVQTEFAQNTSVTLPDASEIRLNADSKVSYNESKWETERSVRLEGEAFFKVAKGKKFTVSTAQGTVAVLGTQFNVENRKGFFEVTCFEGLVAVTYNDQEIRLPAGNSFMVINGEIQDATVPKNTQPSWMQKESSFKSIPLRFVLDEFQRQHNIKVEIQDIDTKQLYTGTFSNTDTNMALQSISVPSQIKFKLEGNKVLFYAENAP